MDRDGVGKLELLQISVGIIDESSLIEFDRHERRKVVYFPDNSHVPVEDALSMAHRDPVFPPHFPFHLVIIPDLHDLVADPEEPVSERLLFLLFIRRIQIFLQDPVHPLDAQKPLLHRGKNLNIERGCVHIARKAVPDELDDVADDPVRIRPLEEEKIPALIGKDDLFPAVDPVRIHNNVRFRRLAEDLHETDCREDIRLKHIPQNRTGSYGGQLVHIPDKDQSRPDRNRRQERVHQGNVHHRHLIDDNDVRLQRVCLVPLKADIFPKFLRGGADFEQPVDRRSFVSRCLCHPLGGTSRRCRQADRQIFGLKVAEHLVNGRGLAGPRPARQNEKPVLRRAHKRPPLLLGQFDRFSGLRGQHMFNAALNILLFVGEHADIEVCQHLRCGKLHIIKTRQVDNAVLSRRVLFPTLLGMVPDHDLSLDRKGSELALHLLVPDAEQIGRP